MSDTPEVAPSPNLHKYNCGNPLYQWHLRAFHDSIYQLLATTGARRVLDAGCGEGFVTNYLAERDPALQLTGVDLSEEAIAYARAHFGEHATYRTGSIYKIPFSDNSFDAVVCSEVLEHLDEPDRALAELKRVARKHVLITVPREPIFDRLNRLGRRLGLSPDPGHVNFWTKRSFQAYLNGHFETVRFAWKHIYQLALAEV